jgi:ribosome-associated protein
MKEKEKSDLEEIVQAIHDKKGFNILVLDVQKISSLTYYFVLAEGRVNRHLKAIANEVLDRMAKAGRKPYHTEGQGDGEWVVLDFSDIIVHLFTPDVREKYGLEEVWRDSKLIECEVTDLDTTGPQGDFDDF